MGALSLPCGRRETRRRRREKREPVRSGPTRSRGTGKNAREIAVEPALGDEFLHRAAQPVPAVAVPEALFEQAF